MKSLFTVFLFLLSLPLQGQSEQPIATIQMDSLYQQLELWVETESSFAKKREKIFQDKVASFKEIYIKYMKYYDSSCLSSYQAFILKKHLQTLEQNVTSFEIDSKKLLQEYKEEQKLVFTQNLKAFVKNSRSKQQFMVAMDAKAVHYTAVPTINLTPEARKVLLFQSTQQTSKIFLSRLEALNHPFPSRESIERELEFNAAQQGLNLVPYIRL